VALSSKLMTIRQATYLFGECGRSHRHKYATVLSKEYNNARFSRLIKGPKKSIVVDGVGRSKSKRLHVVL
jgi:hypothetical protein